MVQTGISFPLTYRNTPSLPAPCFRPSTVPIACVGRSPTPLAWLARPFASRLQCPSHPTPGPSFPLCPMPLGDVPSVLLLPCWSTRCSLCQEHRLSLGSIRGVLTSRATQKPSSLTVPSSSPLWRLQGLWLHGLLCIPAIFPMLPCYLLMCLSPPANFQTLVGRDCVLQHSVSQGQAECRAHSMYSIKNIS